MFHHVDMTCDLNLNLAYKPLPFNPTPNADQPSPLELTLFVNQPIHYFLNDDHPMSFYPTLIANQPEPSNPCPLTQPTLLILLEKEGGHLNLKLHEPILFLTCEGSAVRSSRAHPMGCSSNRSEEILSLGKEVELLGRGR